MATNLKGGGVMALAAGPLKEELFRGFPNPLPSAILGEYSGQREVQLFGRVEDVVEEVNRSRELKYLVGGVPGKSVQPMIWLLK